MKVQETAVDLSRTLIQKGPKFRSHTIVFDEQTAYLKPTLSSLGFCVIYIIVGLFLLGLSITVYLRTGQLDLSIFLSSFGISITTFGCMLVAPFVKQVTFDKSRGTFKNNVDRPVKIENIDSLQVLNKMILSKNGLNYPCYELNLFTKNGRRVNVLNHNDIDQLKSDGEKLADFLSVELLDLQREIIL